jgi:TIR domain/Elongation factor Tu domain 2
VIEKALNESKCVIVLWSERSVKSRYIRDEATYALEKGKLFPVKIENVEVPFRFRGVQTLRLIGWDGSKHFSEFRRLVADMATILGPGVQASVTDRIYQQEQEWSQEETTKPAFYMRIEDIFSITGRGTVVTGVVESGTCETGQEVAILKKGVQVRRAVVLGIEKFRKIIDTAKTGDKIGMLLKDVVKEELERGMVVISRL